MKLSIPSLPELGADHLAAGAAAFMFVIGLSFGWALWHPRGRVVEPPAPAARQADGSLVLQRAPDAHATAPAMVPRGSTLERVVRIVVQPKPRVDTVRDTVNRIVQVEQNRPVVAIDTLTCPPVHVALALVRLPDRTRRVVASSADGTIVGGVDVPVESAAPARTLPWAAGAVYDPAVRTWGAFLHRDVGPLRLGVEAERPTGQRWRGVALVGLRF